ncbi:MAG: type II toxin-antitoxin system Phd/YefM family antitoxin [Lautropia sp.]|nr:type II toxin-antitoxin system Phd/YefM family antitoxin [Lautropia sp.]
MFTITARDARTRFGEMLDRARRAPVRIMHHNREVGVLVSSKAYAAMRAFYVSRLANTLEDNAIEAETKGLTAAKLKHLLADES